jgi:putative ABC transport system ATP-binding protein
MLSIPTNFVAYEGELVGIVGPSGSGKSTFLTILGGLQTPTTGEVIINDEPFSSLDEKMRSKIRLKKIGFILQTSNLIPFFKS